MTYEYRTLGIESGDPTTEETLNQYGRGGFALVATLPFQTWSHSSEDCRGTDYYDKKIQLVFMRTVVKQSP